MSSERPTVTGEVLYRRVVKGLKHAMGDGKGTMDAEEFLMIYAELLGDFIARFVPLESDRDRLLTDFIAIMDDRALGKWEEETLQ